MLCEKEDQPSTYECVQWIFFYPGGHKDEFTLKPGRTDTRQVYELAHPNRFMAKVQAHWAQDQAQSSSLHQEAHQCLENMNSTYQVTNQFFLVSSFFYFLKSSFFYFHLSLNSLYWILQKVAILILTKIRNQNHTSKMRVPMFLFFSPL